MLTMALPAAADYRHGGRFLAAADLRFDPLADPALVDRLALAAPDHWEAVLSEGHGREAADTDTGWPLLRLALGRMKAALPRPVLVLLPGELLAGDLRRRFEAAATDHGDDAYHAFVLRTLAFLSLELRQNFPYTPILPSFAMAEGGCDGQAGGRFRHDTLPILQQLADRPLDAAAVAAWLAFGSYAVPHPGLARVRVVVANTVLLSSGYRGACGDGPDAGEGLLGWLEGELLADQRAGDKVWLVMPVAPGIAPAAVMAGCPAAAPEWDPGYRQRLGALMARFGDIVVAGFTASTPGDDFRLIETGTGRRGFFLSTPALSAAYGRPPAFRVIGYRRDAGLGEQSTFALRGPPVTARADPAPWPREYSFSKVWGETPLNAASLSELAVRLERSPEARILWRRFHGPALPLTAAQERGLICGIAHTTAESFLSCACTKVRGSGGSPSQVKGPAPVTPAGPDDSAQTAHRPPAD
jgi:hypothetical protein